MLDLVRRHIVIITGLALGWSGYSFYDAGDAKPEALAKSGLAEIDPAFLALRDVQLPLTIAGDPYRVGGALGDAGRAQALVEAAGTGIVPGALDASGVPGVPGARSAHGGALASVAPLSQADLVAAFAGALRVVAGEAHTLFAGRASSDAAAAGASSSSVASESSSSPGSAAAATPAASFTLLLQSTLELGGGGQARINGRTVAEGETMSFLDPLDPPRLTHVEGTTVIVAHAGRTYVVDLLDNPLLQVGQPAVVASAAPAASHASTTSKPSATSKPQGQAAATTSPSPADGGKKKGSYRVRGSSTKKKP